MNVIINIPNKKFVQEQLPSLETYLGKRFEDAEEKREDRSKRYTESYELYECLRPSQGESEVVKAVVPIVRNVVDRLQPSLMNIFCENEEQAVIFRPQRSMLPEEVIDAVNLKINDVFLRQNDGYNVLANAYREALVTGDAFLKTFIDTETIEEEVDFGEEGVPFEMLALALTEYPDTDPAKVEMYNKTIVDEITQEKVKMPFVTGKVTLTRIERKPRVKFIPFNEIFTAADSIDIENTRYICHRIKKTAGELIEMGFDKELIGTAKTASFTSEALSTKDLSNTGKFTNDDDLDEDNMGNYDPAEKPVFLYEHYIYTSLLDKKGRSKLYQVFAINVDTILEVNEVPRIPFVHGVPDRIPGAFWGKGMGEVYGNEQILLTSLLRDYASISKHKAHPSFIAIKDQYNRQSLLNSSRPGSVVEVTQAGAVTPVDLTGQVGDLLGVLQFVQNTTTEGIMNSIGAGLNPSDAANMSATAVAISTHNTEMKDKRIAKSLAYTMVRPLFEQLYYMIRDEALPLEVEGMVPTETGEMVPQVVPFDSAMLPSRSEFYIDVNTSADDAIQVNTLNQMATMIAQLSSMPSPVITPENLYNIGSRILKTADINNVDDFISDPSATQPSPEEQAMAQQQQMMELQQAKDAAEAQLGIAAAQQNKLETETEELIKMNNWKREMDERQLLVDMEKLEVQKVQVMAKAEQEVIRNGLRAEELAIEAQTGQTLGVN